MTDSAPCLPAPTLREGDVRAAVALGGRLAGSIAAGSDAIQAAAGRPAGEQMMAAGRSVNPPGPDTAAAALIGETDGEWCVARRELASTVGTSPVRRESAETGRETSAAGPVRLTPHLPYRA